jgi:hypothetical protein
MDGHIAGTAELTAEQLGALIDGKTYINIHTAANPSGEIRGQVESSSVSDLAPEIRLVSTA